MKRNLCPAPPVLTLHEVSFTYSETSEPALHRLSLSVYAGEWIAVIGPGGSGKSTLCRLVSGLMHATPGIGAMEGTMELGENAEAVSAYGGTVGYVSQDPETGIAMEIVEDELAFGPENLRVPEDQLEIRIDRALAAVGLPLQLRPRRTNELSGGQQQRVAIAAALAMEPQLLVFDDAAANLDADGAQQLLAAQRELHRRGATLLTAAPRWDGAAAADRVLLLDGGRIVGDGAPEQVLASHRDTLRKLGCLPDEGEDRGAGTSSADSETAIVLEARGASYTYGGGDPALKRVDALCRTGEIVAVVGPNGAGKTTFGKLIAGLLPAPAGTVKLLDQDVSAMRPEELARIAGYVFQRPERQFLADTVLEEVLFGLRVMRKNRELRSEDTERGVEQLRLFGLDDVRGAHPQTLSVAQQRMLNLASVLLMEPAILVLDEPTAGLDYAAADGLMRHCADFAARGGAVLVITHDPHVIRRWSTRQIAFGPG